MDTDVPVASSSTEQPEKRTVQLQDVLNKSLNGHHELMQVIAELFKRSERSEQFINDFERLEGFSNTVKRMRSD